MQTTAATLTRTFPLLNTLCLPVARWGFTLLAVAGLYADMPVAALLAAGLATIAWRHN